MKLLQILLLFTIVLVIAAAGLFYMPKRTLNKTSGSTDVCQRSECFLCKGI